ncbi:pyridine nucleotide-disulfide oxidoreductase-domain-containing protein [Absidia repens]|uniref:Pyridine nucleotide-disulfide oxidoreductase-domain-containing protein n=1 Tax=Absidia repens TaxID=90262 RepID=A0A1X2I303_9FUNG|nr:pyridine nucleotide-disulfide oxidoreductase-domain-containing protein [Absidia repens]
MRELDRTKYDVFVVSPRNYFVFTPLLASTSVGSLEFRCVTEPVRGYSKDITYHQASCDDIDLDNKVIHCVNQVPNAEESTFTLNYDTLVIGVGSYSNTFGIPGVKENACFLKDVQDARKIRRRLIECLTDSQKRDKLHFVVVGCGATGIEFSAELHDFISSDVSRLYPDLVPLTKMTLYDVAPQILSGFDSQLSEYAHQQFDRKGIQIKTQRHVENVQQNKLMIRDEGEVPFGLLVWSTGLMQNPLVAKLGVAKDSKNQRILTDSNLQVLDYANVPYPDVYAVGDCATIDNHDLPLTAQVANQKAIYLTLNRKSSTSPGFKFKDRGMMAYIGSAEALVDMSSVHQGAKNSGHLAWLLWRSAYFSMSMSIRNKLLIPYYWLLTWSFGRDISRF